MTRFAGRVAVVTGAGGGIGSAISVHMARDGATIVLVDIDADQVIAQTQALRGNHFDAHAMVLDVTSPQAVDDAMKRVAAEHGPVDILVNNAGINRRGSLLELTDEDWSTSFAVNLDSMFYLCRAVLPQMVSRGGGAIINTASQWGLHPAPGHIAYNVTKAAVISFTQSLARDYAPHGIRVNAVAPGEILTPMVQSNLERQGRHVADLDAKVPFGRVGRPEEVAALVTFLASDDAPFICGSVVEITGAQAVA
jgi:2-hydroxycyclohexanecarboxyl-CoA dehydrogenase